MVKVFRPPADRVAALPMPAEAPGRAAIRSSGSVRPDAAGDLAETPFAEVLIALLRRQASGTLVLWPDDFSGREHRIQLEQGIPTAVDLGRPAVRIQDALLSLFASGRRYSYYEQMPLGESPTLLRGVADPLPLLVRGVLAHARGDDVDATLREVEGRPLQLAEGLKLSRLRLRPEEETVADLLRHEAVPASTIVATSFLPLEEARRLVYLLLLLGAVQPA